jgi:hypothetical protein
MDYIIGAFYGSAGRNDFFYFRPFMIGAMWFFLALLWGLLFLHLIIKIKHIWVEIPIVLMCFTASLLISKYIWLPLSFQAGLCAFLFIYLGYKFKEQFIKFNSIIAFICFLIFVISIYASITYGAMDMATGKYPVPILNVTGAVSGSYLIVQCCKKLVCIKIIKQLLSYYGKYSSIIYCGNKLDGKLPWSLADSYFPMINYSLIHIAQFIIRFTLAYFYIQIVLHSEKLKRIFL